MEGWAGEVDKGWEKGCKKATLCCEMFLKEACLPFRNTFCFLFNDCFH